MATVFDVADFFLASQDCTAGDTISNLKLQKLCYYAQGFTLAMLGKPLFAEKVEAWKHGPVIPDLYNRYSQYASNSIPVPGKSKDDIIREFTAEEYDVLCQVNEEYGQFSAWRLRNFTHEESPWRNHYHGDSWPHEEIPLQDMKIFFDTQVRDAI